jgi:phosphomethylpyrimidine synthase
MSAAADKFLSQTAKVDPESVQPFPNSSKVYEQGSRPDIQVPMREIRLADTHTSEGIQQNAPIFVYDTSGPYTDPAATIDVRKGLPALRGGWIAERDDTETLDGLSSDYGRARLDDANLEARLSTG